jgi:hypothetical protein
MSPFWKVIALWILLLLFPGCRPRMSAQELPPDARSLARLSQKAGYIFAGTVTAVERVASTSAGEMTTMRISFRVDQAIRGVRNGETLTIREWAGLWESGERYRQGERLVLFLYPPSRLGLTSTVAGPLGRFPVDGDGYVALDPSRGRTNDSATKEQRKGGTRMSSGDFVRAIRRAQEE